MAQTFKLVVVGDGGVGKSTWIKRLLIGAFEEKYIATLGVEVHPITLENEGVVFNTWDTAGQEKLGGLRDGYYIGADAAVICYDIGSRTSFKNVVPWARDVHRVAPGIPIVLVGMKGDLPAESVRVQSHGTNPRHFVISARTKINLYAPLVYLAKVLRARNEVSLSELERI